MLFYVLFVLFRSLYCLCVYMCTELLRPGGYPVTVKYIISYHICILWRVSTYLVGEYEGERILGRSKYIWEDNIKLYAKDIG